MKLEVVKVSFSCGDEEKYFNLEDISPVGILDSGIGGLTVLKAISKCMPYEDIIYFGDTKRVPYGQRSKEEIVRYALQAINFLISKGAKIILIACGTVTSYISDIKDAFDEKINIFGIITPASRGAVRATQSGSIGVICTPVSAKVGLYEKTILKIKPECKVHTLGCPVLAPLIEKGITDKNYDQINEAVRSYIDSLKKKNVDTIILGCTHYPIVKNTITKHSGEGIVLIDPGEELAGFLKGRLRKSDPSDNKPRKRNIRFFVSGDTKKFERDIKNILGMDCSFDVGQVDIESY